MIGKLIFAFIIVPLVDLFILLQLASIIGALETFAIVVVTGIVGGYLAKTQGFQTIRRLQYRINQGESPSQEMADGALILVGAALLVTPGLLTDTAGFILLLPYTRPYVRRILTSYFKKKAEKGRITIETYP